jgi:hypothetical protein
MKKIWSKPVLARRGALARLTAKVVVSPIEGNAQ